MTAAKMPAGSVIRFHTPELPELDGAVDRLTLANQIFLENAGERLTALALDGSTKLVALETVSMSHDGLTQRLTLKKEMSFHCGAEVTATDAVATIVRVLKNDRSASQLNRHIAKDKAQPHGFAVYSVSRYRFEIKLNGRLPDLLARLALNEFTLRHEGRLCLSGLWRIIEKDPRGILLAVHSGHARAADSQYQGVRWERVGPAEADAAAFGGPSQADPHMMVYPGTYLKSPPEELLVDEICRPLDAGVSLLAKVPTSPDSSDLRGRLHPALRAAFTGNSLWRRSPSISLVPKGHVLHIPFVAEPAHPSAGAKKPLRVVLQVDKSLLSPQLWDKLSQVAQDEHRLELAVAELGLAVTAGTLPVPVTTSFHGHPADAFTPVAAFAADLGAKIERLDLAHDLVQRHGYLPLLQIPFMVRGNRNLRRSETTGLLHFVDVRQSADRLRKVKLKDTAQRALGDALQMFVHDVRRPFTLIQGLLGLLESADSSERLKDIAGRYLGDVRQAVISTDRMIQDVLEIGSDADPVREVLEIEAAIEAVLKEVFAGGGMPGLTFDYRFSHKRKLHADPLKFNRVLTNLLVNAVEAMRGQGQIWFATADHPTDRQMLITVGNTGSFIPPEALDGLFERFYTEGKQRGTGLGLAIVKKVVNDHGGDVWCESELARGTWFTMALPLATEVAGASKRALPKRVDQIRVLSPDRGGTGAESCIKKLAKRKAVEVLLVDDDAIYHEVIKTLLTAEERRRGHLEFHTATCPEAAEAIVLKTEIAIAIVDVDLGAGVMNGLGLARRLRTLRPDLRICIHSHGTPFALSRQALAAGGDLFLPKPMSREHLLKLLDAFAEEQDPSNCLKIAVVDDDALMLEMWLACPGPHWVTFESPEELTAAMESDPSLLPSLDCVITDLSFANVVPDGYQLATELRALRPDLPIYVSTNRPVAAGDKPAAVTAYLPKNPKEALALIRGNPV